MKNISTLQKNFARHIYQESNKRIIDSLPYSNQEALARLNIYRNNVFGNFDSVLESIFEATKKVVGAKYFSQIAAQYHQRHFSRSGNLDHYGDKFPDFIKHISKQHKLAYLHDLCRLELLYHQAYFVKNVDDFDIKKFQKIPQEKFFNLTFELHPSCFLFSSKFPIFTIWKESLKKSGRKKISLTEAELALVSRASGKLEITKMSPEEFVFLSNLKQQKTLFETYKKILRLTKKECDIGALLQAFINSRVITNFKLKESK